MKKKSLEKAMLAGMIGGTFCIPSLIATESSSNRSSFLELIEKTKGNIAAKALNSEDLLLELTQDGADTFNSLSPEGKALALKLASRGCNNNNDCAGQNACRTEYNECAGKGSCKGQTKCAFSDKNLAVRVAAQIMAKKRQKLVQ